MLQANGLKLGTGTIVDATIIGAPSSTKNADKQRDPDKAPGALDLTNRTVRKGSVTEELERMVNRAKSRFEHVFRVVKRLWGFDKARYRGLTKNATRAFVATPLANIFLARKRLVA